MSHSDESEYHRLMDGVGYADCNLDHFGVGLLHLERCFSKRTMLGGRGLERSSRAAWLSFSRVC